MPTEKTEDMTPEELRTPLLAAMLQHVPFDGWSTAALKLAAKDSAISAELAELAFPRGAIEALELHLCQADKDLAHALADKNVQAMKIREGIIEGIRTRLKMPSTNREVVRRGLAVLALPQNIALGSKSLWRTADIMWKAVGDTSTDHNWYTKRATLSAVYSAVLLYWLNDDSEDYADTWAFLDRRIEGVMKFEKTKFQIKKALENAPSLARFLGRLRYPGI